MLLAVGNVKHNFTDILHKLVHMHQQCFRVAWERGYVRTYIQSCNTYSGPEGTARFQIVPLPNFSASKLFRSQIVPLPNCTASKLGSTVTWLCNLKIYYILVTSLKTCKIRRLSSCVIKVHCACATIDCLRFTILVTTTLLHHNHTPPPFIAAAYGGPAACCGMAERARWIDER